MAPGKCIRARRATSFSKQHTTYHYRPGQFAESAGLCEHKALTYCNKQQITNLICNRTELSSYTVYLAQTQADCSNQFCVLQCRKRNKGSAYVRIPGIWGTLPDMIPCNNNLTRDSIRRHIKPFKISTIYIPKEDSNMNLPSPSRFPSDRWPVTGLSNNITVAFCIYRRAR